MGNLSTAKDYGNFSFVTFFQKASYMLDLEGKVMLIGFGSEFNLFKLDLNLFFLGFLQSLALLILVLAVIQDTTNRRIGIR